MQLSRFSRAVWMCVVFAMMLVGTSRVAAAPLDIDIVDEDFGFCDGLVPERWSPLRVSIASRKVPFSGTMSVSYAQDGTQSVQVEMSVATTVGQITPIEVVVCVPESLSQITFTFVDGSSGRFREFRYELGGSLSQSTDYRDLPPEDAIGRRIVMFDGPRGLEEAITQRNAVALTQRTPDASAFPSQPPNPTASPWLTTWSANLTREQMPLTWIAYDSADVVVVRGDVGVGADVVDARSLEALKAWVKAGGKLVVLVEPAGDGWARFMDGLDMVRVGEVQSRRTPSRTRAVLLAPGDPEEGPDAKSGFDASSEVTARWMSLTETGVARGWKLEHVDVARPVDATTGTEQSTGVCAVGSVGLGTVMLVSCDPAKIPAVASSAATKRLWRDILSIILDRGTPRYVPSQNQWGTWYAGTSSGSNDAERAALEYVLSSITRVPNLGHGTFIAIAGVVLVLALLVGPFDAIVLRKRGWRQHSWATALLWVAIASAASVAAPMLIRSGEDRAFRFAAYDAIAGPDGAIEFACREGTTTVLPGKGGLAKVKDDGNGVSYRGATPIVKRARDRVLGTVLALQQRVGETGTLRGIMPSKLGLRQWSVRAMVDECPSYVGPELSALRVQCSNVGTCQVKVTGLPAGASVLRATVQSTHGWHTMSATEDPATWADAGNAQAQPPADWNAVPVDSYTWRYQNGSSDINPGFVGVGAPGVARAMPLSSMRTSTIERLVATGQWACVHLHVLNWPSDVKIESERGWTTESQAVLSVVVPVRQPPVPSSSAPSSDPAASQP